jgi:hypothetical protein
MLRRAFVVLLFTAACSSPNVDEYLTDHAGRIDGTIFYPSGSARGNAVVLLFDQNHLPPPAGTSTTVANLVIVSEQTLFRDAPANAVADFTAAFTIPVVPPGTYQIRAFLDASHTFNPVVPLADGMHVDMNILAEPTAGDVAGGYLDRNTKQFLPITVEADKVTSEVTVTLGLTLPVERPAFAITSSLSFTVPYATPQTLTLTSHPIVRNLVKMDPQKTAFLVQYVNDPPSDTDGDHLLDVYPKVLLRRIDPAPDANGTIVIPGIVDPYPFLDQLGAHGSAVTTRLDVMLPPLSVLHTNAGDTIMPGVPPGRYEVNVILGTGQTWTVPNNIDGVDPVSTPDPTQSAAVTMVQGAQLSRGTITGTLHVMDDKKGDAFVFAFDVQNPPPPLAGGRPVAVANVPLLRFMESGGGQLTAPFTLTGLKDGMYVLRALVDPPGTFSLFDDLVAQPQRGDFGGPAMAAAITIANQNTIQNVEIDLTVPVLFDRPAFEFADLQVPRTGFPTVMTLSSHPISALKMTADTAKAPIVLAPGDDDGDNLRDLYPRIILTKMLDAGSDPRATPDDPSGLFIPALVDPIDYFVPLALGTPAIPSASYRVILPPYAARIGPSGMLQLVAPPPAGRYRVNVLSATGQTWSVPSDLDVVLRREGTPLEDPTQSKVVRVMDAPVPQGAITGTIQLGVPAPPGAFEIVLLAFLKAAPPPPFGSGRPIGQALVSKDAFQNTATAPYAIGNLPSGTYQVRAFLDANHDFVPWFGTMNQPDMGDVGGGVLTMQGFKDITVDAAGAPVTGADVAISSQLAFPTDRPAFGLAGTGPTWDGLALTSVALSTVAIDNALLRQHGAFLIQWVDLNGDGVADDLYGKGSPDVFPLVAAELLDPADPTNSTLSANPVVVHGFLNPTDYAPGFPAQDPTQVKVVVGAGVVRITFPPVAVDAGGNKIAVPNGRYRITLIEGTGQTWTVPNELQRATGTASPMNQAGYLTVRH